MGAVGLLRGARQRHLGGSDGHGGWTHLLFPRRCFPASTGWLQNFENSPLPVSLLNVLEISIVFIQSICSKKVFNEVTDDPNYTALPEDRPGGFNWGERRRPPAEERQPPPAPPAQQ